MKISVWDGNWNLSDGQELPKQTLLQWFGYKQKILCSLGLRLKICSGSRQGRIYMGSAAPTGEKTEDYLWEREQGAVCFHLQKPSKEVKAREKKINKHKNLQRIKTWKNRIPQSPSPWEGWENLNQGTSLTETHVTGLCLRKPTR